MLGDTRPGPAWGTNRLLILHWSACGPSLGLLEDRVISKRSRAASWRPPGAIDYASMAERLGANEGTARVVVHRFRKRFREV
jgi:hypothetical protein